MNNSIFFIEGDIITPTIAKIVLLLGHGEMILMLNSKFGAMLNFTFANDHQKINTIGQLADVYLFLCL
jgi:hypothetical protein